MHISRWVYLCHGYGKFTTRMTVCASEHPCKKGGNRKRVCASEHSGLKRGHKNHPRGQQPRTVTHVHGYTACRHSRLAPRARPTTWPSPAAGVRPNARASTVCCFRAHPPPAVSDPSTTNMPWRELIFTDTGVVYPATWDMNKYNRDNSKSMVHKELTDAASLAATPLAATPGKDNMHFPSLEDFADNGDCTSEDSSPAAVSIATQDLFSRRDAAPESPSFPRTDERAALPAETSPCSTLRTEGQQGPLLRSSSKENRASFIKDIKCLLNRTRLYYSERSSHPVRRTVQHTAAPPTSPVNRFEDDERIISFSCEDHTLTPSAWCSDDPKASGVLETKIDTVG
jgi:hypothetical protein